MRRLTTYDQYVKKLTVLEERIENKKQFPFSLPAIRSLDELIFHPNVTYIMGENGMGKSTLLEAIAVNYGFNPEGGTKNFNFASYESHSNLDRYIRLSKGVKRPKDGFFFRAETFYNVATNIEELDEGDGGPKIIDRFGGKSLHEQSHGESFFAAFMNRFSGNGLYILDEPEAALSPMRQLSLLARIHELIENGSQFIISTHSPLLMAYPESTLYQLNEVGISTVTLEETEHYQIMEQFFNDKQRLFYHLFQR
ncbi:AAA family ATPase [Alkalihalobacillus pseudalcaliphilus]|uniref:AAA family ATPase n=1 Tax=Alkalihalobacillus pseudalcaliphilus TaxID=79884 RepID=UPI00064D7BF9|nr:AAA family ATPase [Alkalihalobacillus pseudalcaliphilus]KMK75601.1 ATPase AAA [Alkalihalobacillus pseudalcaliphilus]